MKIALAQLNYRVGDFEANAYKIVQFIKRAKTSSADLIVFSELSLCGYPPKDLLEFSSFINLCEKFTSKIASECIGIACILGLPTVNKGAGKRLFNSAYFLMDGKIQAITHKALLPTYDVFNEYRYFEPAQTFNCIHFMDQCIALTICEDLWNNSDSALYLNNPMDQLVKEKPTLIINIAASPFTYLHNEQRMKILSRNSKKYQLPIFYVNQVGAQTDLIFDGGSMVYNEKGQLLSKMKHFEEDFQVYDLSNQSRINDLYPFKQEQEQEVEQIQRALILGIRDYFKKSGFEKAVLGLSGGIDSALVCVLAAQALGAKNVLAVLMPSMYSTHHSLEDALKLVEKLGCKHQIISIEKAAKVFDELLMPIFKGLPRNITEENIQARCRATILMAFSNKLGYILLNTSNKSEYAVGYGTLYGDMAGAISVLGDVYKTQVYQLAAFINEREEIIPQNSILKAPSAELSPNQKDSDALPPYDLLDKILFQHIELKRSSKAIVEMGFEEEVVNETLKKVNAAEFKRQQAPPVLRISTKAFGSGRSMPVVSKLTPDLTI